MPTLKNEVKTQTKQVESPQAFFELVKCLIKHDLGPNASREARNDNIRQHAAVVGFDLGRHPHPGHLVKTYLVMYLRTRRESLSPNMIRPLEELYKLITTCKPKDEVAAELVAMEMGLSPPRDQEISDLLLLPGVPVIRLTRRKQGEYPPRNHIVLECHGAEDALPTLPPNASSSDTFLILDSKKLHTCAQDRSAIFVDSMTNEVVAIVLRDMMKSHFQAVQQSLVDQVTDSLQHDTTKEQHSKRVYGWSKTSLQNPTSQKAETKDSQMASLFVFFFSLILGRFPWLAGQFQTAMRTIEIPGIDILHGGQFTVPGPESGSKMTFRGKALAPPEGHVTRNLVEPIHKVNHWVSRSKDGEYISCPWAARWTLSRDQKDGNVGSESGASLFISEYALRIINSSNTFIASKLSHWHGTGWSYNDLTQVSMVLQMSKMAQVEHEEFLKKRQRGEIQKGEMPWNPQ
jgi:hypothetical protein